MRHELVQQSELAVREIDDDLVQPRLPAREVELEPAGADERRVVTRVGAPAKLDADAREELVERERLRDVVGGAELEAAQLRRGVRARGEDHDGQVGPPARELPQHRQAVDAREQEVEYHEVVVDLLEATQRHRSVPRDVDDVTLGVEPARDERENPRLVLDDQYAHRLQRRPYRALREDDNQMTVFSARARLR